MKRWGTVALMLFAFVAGFTLTYNCGGGSSAEASGDADTLQGHPASDFALSTHEHDAGDITSGVFDVSLIPSHTHSQYALTNHSHSEYALSNHTHDASVLVTGTVPTGRLTGTYGINITGNAATATNAGTLDSLDSSDFAESDHTHSRLVFGDLSGWWTRREIVDFKYPGGGLFSNGYQETEVEIIHSDDTLSFRDSNTSETVVVTINDGNFSYSFEDPDINQWDFVINGVVISDTSMMGHTFQDRDADDATYVMEWIYQRQ